MNEIRMIPIKQLSHHPDNPRKGFGDLTELIDSIKASGVLQNLTVVFEDGFTDYDNPEAHKYWVVIGNRRLEAAKKAGLKELPCCVSNMDHKQQISTMLEENMHRTDLTIYEQAQGFQMMMDLGFTEDQICETSGFSKTTVRHRLKMAELDQKLLKKACTGEHDRQITMFDFERLGKIDDIKERNSLLKEIGESNFNWQLNRALQKQTAKKNLPAVMKILKEAGAQPIKQNERYGCGYVGNWEWRVTLYEWKEGDRLLPKTDKPLFYYLEETEISFYTQEEKKKEEKVERSAAEIEKEKKRNKAWKQIDEDTKQASELRRAFEADLKMTPKNAPVMLTHFVRAVVLRDVSYTTPTEHIKEVIGVNDAPWNQRTEKAAEILQKYDITEIPKIIAAYFEGDKPEKFAEGTKSCDMPKFKRNPVMEACYEWLTSYGYVMSDTEIQLMCGTHPCFEQVKKNG